MMKLTTAKLALAGCLALGVGFSVAWAATADEKIKARQAQMKGQGKAMGELAKIYKEEAPFDAAAVKAQLDSIHSGGETAMAAGGWDAESAKGESTETWAKPELWSDTAGSKEAWENLSKGLTAVGAATDLATFKPAFEQLGGSCKGCHDKFRRPKET